MDPSGPVHEQLTSAEAFARLAVELHDSHGMVETVEAVADYALQALSARYAAVVLLHRGRRPEVAAITDPVVENLYQLQLDLGVGPLPTAIEEGRLISVPDPGADSRWPDEWRAAIKDLGIAHVLHLPLIVADRPVGVLSLFGLELFSEDDVAIAHILARHASVAVANARQEETLAQAVDARKLVGQAMGILMERFDLDGDRAFEVLKRYSQDTNRKLRDVAAELIETRRLPKD